MDDSAAIIINSFRRAGFGEEEIKKISKDVAAKVNEGVLREVMSKLTDGEVGELGRRLGEALKQACDGSVNKPDFQKIGRGAALDAWKSELEKLDQSVVEKLKGPLEEYLKANQEEAKKMEALLAETP